jgi:hypothetical protein
VGSKVLEADARGAIICPKTTVCQDDRASPATLHFKPGETNNGSRLGRGTQARPTAHENAEPAVAAGPEADSKPTLIQESTVPIKACDEVKKHLHKF